MDYAKAQKIRNKSFGTLLAEQKGGLGESLKKTISQKTQAKMTGIKEKFDPMNMVKFMTGGSNWAPAMLGKLTNRKQSSIDFFTGVKRRGKGTADKLGSVDGSSGGGNFLGILHNIESLLHTTREEDKLKAEEENNYAEENKLEKERRHKELMEALTGKKYKGKETTATKVENPTETPSGLDLTDVMSMFNLLKSAGPWLATLLSPVALAAAISALIIGGAAIKGSQEVERYRELGGDDAADIAAERQTEEYLGAGDPGALGTAIMNAGEETKGEKLTKLVKKKQEIVKILMENEGFKKTEEDNQGRYLFKNSEGQTPNPELLKTVNNQANLYLKSNTLPEAINTPGNEQLKKESNEDVNKPAGVPSPSSAAASTPSPASIPSTATPASDKEVPSASNTPPAVIPTPVASQELANVQKENLDLKTPQSKPDEASVVNNTINKSSNNGGQKRKPIPPVRNPEITFQRMILKSTRVV